MGMLDLEEADDEEEDEESGEFMLYLKSEDIALADQIHLATVDNFQGEEAVSFSQYYLP